jgi:hypothetical protein
MGDGFGQGMADFEEKAAGAARRRKKEGLFWAAVAVIDLVAVCLLAAGIWQRCGPFWGQFVVATVGTLAMSSMALTGVSAWLKS